MANKPAYKTTFEPENTIQPIYTGGSVALDQSGRILATCLGGDALLTDLNTGNELARIEGDGEQISTLTLTPSAEYLIICSRSLSMRIYALKPSLSANDEISFELLRTVKPHPTPVIVLAVDQTSTLIATGAADGAIKVWDIRGGYVTHTFKGSNVLVSALHFFEIIASNREEETGISARNRKKAKKGGQEQEENSDPATRGFRLASGTQDGDVRVWDLFKRNCAAILKGDDKKSNAHAADVRTLDYSPEENALLTGSRDKTLTWWDARTWKKRKGPFAVSEEIEAAGFLKGGAVTYTGGVNGRIRLWETDRKTDAVREITKPQNPGMETEGILNIIHYKDLPFLLSVHADQTLVLHSTAPISDDGNFSLDPLPQIRRISGTHDEIIDLGYVLPDRSLLALATNSEELRIVSVSQSASEPSDPSSMDIDSAPATYFGADVAQLKGHDDIIICISIDWSGHWIATGAKDNTAKLWLVDPSTSTYTCYTTFTGHAESIGAISLPSLPPPSDTKAYQSPTEHPPPFVITGSQDQTIKRWDVPKSSSTGKAPRAVFTRKAHDKDINAIDTNHNSTLFASASQDRTVKIWSVEEGEVQGVLRGHRRGVWSVKFAPKNTPSIASEEGPAASGKGLILTGSGDKTVKIWNLYDYSCICTFDGHTNSVLKVAWLNLPEESRGNKAYVQVASAGADGLVKVWSAHSGETETTLDNHIDRVWALAVHPETNTIVSGSGDSTVTFWKDTSKSTQESVKKAQNELVEKEQELMNYMRQGSYRDAITLALQLNHPGRLLSLFTNVVQTLPKEEGSLTGVLAVDEVLRELSDQQLFILLTRVRDWNTNARTAVVAQRILGALVRSYPASRFVGLRGAKGKGKGVKEVLDALKGYTERHYKRMEELVDQSYLVELMLKQMDGLSGDAEAGVEGRLQMMELDRDVIEV